MLLRKALSLRREDGQLLLSFSVGGKDSYPYSCKQALDPPSSIYAHPTAPLAIFKSSSRDSNGRIAELYLDLECEFHLVQGDPKSPPCVPGLTPAGFAIWIKTNILAYPDVEARRLEQIVCDCPINADNLIDGKPERLPKRISRHLLPDKTDKKSRSLLDAAMKDFNELYGPVPSPVLKLRHDSIFRSRQEGPPSRGLQGETVVGGQQYLAISVHRRPGRGRDGHVRGRGEE